MAPTLVREPFHRDSWVYEEKVDGWRMLAYKDAERVRLVSRNGRDHTRRKAMKYLEEDNGDINKAFNYVAGRKSALKSKVWKRLDATTTMLNAMPLDEIEDMRGGDVAKLNAFEALVKAIDRVKRELRK